MDKYFSDLHNMKKQSLRRIHDSRSRYYESDGPSIFEYSMFTAYPKSPTACVYKKAFELFFDAQEILYTYKKEKVETNEDCECLKSAFHGFARANLCEAHLSATFCLPANILDLIDQYLKIRPNDILVEYFRTAIIFSEHPFVSKCKNGYSSVKHLKQLIIMHEELAFKVNKTKPQPEIHRDLLIHLYFLLGSLYSNTDQEVRALDSFQKSYDIDNSNLDSLYAVAFYKYFTKSDKAESMLKKYLQLASQCHKRYYDAFYTLALIELDKENIELAKKYYYKGVAAEKKQLPCLPAWDTFSRKAARLNIHLLEGLDDLHTSGVLQSIEDSLP
ncbi:Hypothetical predicted protein [Mytilus galloprovincialis]|uniref:Uncharacterized protein n=1 Tax=Mytilus galloprovincialis TaxID=29158 RepID=A0A8B6BZQ3_MYTGA|nr:Hypothetical predicted protein [Mytilus galloprovincialis]